MKISVRCDQCGKVGGDEIADDGDGRDLCPDCVREKEINRLKFEITKMLDQLGPRFDELINLTSKLWKLESE